MTATNYDDELVDVIVAQRRTVGYNDANGVLVYAGPGTTIKVTLADEKYLRETGAIVDPDGQQPPVIVTPVRSDTTNNPMSIGSMRTTV